MSRLGDTIQKARIKAKMTEIVREDRTIVTEERQTKEVIGLFSSRIGPAGCCCIDCGEN